MKRKIDEKIRDVVRGNVLARDRGCRALGVEIERRPGGSYAVHERCEFYPWADRPGLEVHELWPGAGRVTAWLDEQRCIAVCPKAHDHITGNPDQATAVGLIVRRDG